MCCSFLRKMRAVCIACALFAVSCAHHHDASADDSEDRPAAHHHRGNTENIRPSSPDLGGF
jgi:hypothetical protein